MPLAVWRRTASRSWLRLSPENLTFGDVVETYLQEMVALGQGHNLEAFARDFRARGISLQGNSVRREEMPPPASAPYFVRWQWIRRQRRDGQPARSSGLDDSGSIDRIYHMFDHSFRLDA